MKGMKTVTLTEEEAATVQAAIDSLASRLADAGCLFSEGEVAIQERASELLGTKSGVSFIKHDEQ